MKSLLCLLLFVWLLLVSLTQWNQQRAIEEHTKLLRVMVEWEVNQQLQQF